MNTIPVVRFDFACGGTEWAVRRVSLGEELGRPYRCVLELATEDTELSVDDLVGASATLEIARDEKIRLVHGYVDEVEHLGVASHKARVRVHVGPLLSWLDRGRNSRIFQEKTVPDIIEELIKPVLPARGRLFDLSALQGPGFAPRDFCVQFNESDLDFLHRLLEEEGLTYYFDHGRAEWETVVFAATNGDFPAFENLQGNREAPLIRDDDAADIETISAFDWSRRARAPRTHQRDWDWKPNPPDIYEATHENVHSDESAVDALPALEVYEHGDHRLLDPLVEARAARKQQAMAVRDAWGTGRSNATGFSPGHVFELIDDDLGRPYLLTRVVHEGDAPEGDLLEGGVTAAPSYQNRFECIPADTVYRPARNTPRPVIPGPQTAVVTGPPNEEIYTDEHGRIKVRLHWDRSNSPPEDASCWIRVAQMWGGPGWGTVFLPRVGMEVIVTFINGDPDRPLVTGCVYNGGNQPPYPLPDEKTKTTIKSSSSPGGDGHNELTFEDAAGAEQIIVHAQRDLNETVRRNNSRSVGAAESISVGGSRSVTVTGKQAVVVNGKGSSGEELGGPHYSVNVDSAYALDASKTVHVSAPERITLQCQSTIIELTPTTIVLQAGKGADGQEGSRIQLDIEALMRSKKEGVVHLDSLGNVAAKAKDEASLSLTEAAVLRSKAGATVGLDGTASIEAPGGSEGEAGKLLLDANATMTAHQVQLTSQNADLTMTTAATLWSGELTMIQGNQAACVGAEAVIAQGASVDMMGGMLVNIRAPIVKVN